ncbi:hypothetical protein SASPL_117848 [Salvia splendens]|uniref:4-coumarate--CoA ligase n=1 Tax=Salvia splendens TaxID=180675 RepID=A0A8X8XWA9_SALSN|nr:hypothetical protein SASPL_117848 [Salvia splendens]
MAEKTTSINPQNGFCPQTKTYQSLRPAVPLPPPSQPLSIFQYALSLLHSSALSTTPFLIDAPTARHLTYSSFLRHVSSLSASLKPLLSQNDVAFILSPPSLHLPALYFSLLSLGAVVSPSNPLSSPSDLAHQIALSRPALVFATAEAADKIPQIDVPIIILDSPLFLSMLECDAKEEPSLELVDQSAAAAILYSSGTTGRVKGVVLTHRNLIALMAGMYHNKLGEDEVENAAPHPVSILTVPMYKVTYMPVTPPLVVAMAKSDLVDRYDLSSLQALGCGGAPLGKEVSERFREKFPHVEILQGYGLTESTGGATRTMGPDEAKRHGSAGRLSENMEAKIVDPETGEALPPTQRGELWLRGPSIMKGYAGDDAATAAALDSQGWLRTGDLCYFDQDGFLFIVDRLKELIKYKAYQVPPAELEHLLQSIPEIADAAVVPYPDEEAGEIPMAYVVRKAGSNMSAAEIMDYIEKQVAPYKKIRRLAFIDSIPKSPAGKILRRDLQRHALSKL